jgi:glycosyltransferase involved in cell wall biosynthesis
VRLVVWHTDPYPTAPGVYLGAFPRFGHHVTWVISTEGERHQSIVREENGVRVIEIQRPKDVDLPRPWGAIVNRWNKLVRLFAKIGWMRRLVAERPDVLQVRELITEGTIALPLARSQRVPFAFQWDFPHYEAALFEMAEKGSKNVFRALHLRWVIALRAHLLRGADLVLPISEGLGAIARDRHGVDPWRIVPFPVGVSAGAPERARTGTPHPKAAGLAGKPVLCYLGNLDAVRQPSFLFDVFAAVLEQVPDAWLLLVGRENPGVTRLLEGHAARQRVVFTGYVPHQDVPATIAQAKVGVYPVPLTDPFGIYRTCSPLKVVEYMACGLPVVASRVEEAEKMLGESGGGVCVDNFPKAFAREIAAYLGDPARARADGEKGRAYVERVRVFEALGKEVEAAYRRLLDTGRPAAPGSPLLAGRRVESPAARIGLAPAGGSP